MIKRTLKFTLCTGLLAAGVLAYAEGPVTLKDKTTTTTWAAFVEAINNPATVEGDIETDLAVTNSLRTALNRAKTTLDTRITASYTAQATVTTDSNAVVTANATLDTKRTALTTAQNTYSDASQKYNDAIGKQPAAQRDVDAKQKIVDDLTAQIKTKYTDHIKIKNDSIDLIDKTLLPEANDNMTSWQELMESVMVASTTPATWLTTAETDANNFANAMEIYNAWYGEMEGQGKNPENETYDGENGTIYIKLGTNTSRTKVLDISFDSSLASSGYTPYNVQKFDDLLNGSLANGIGTCSWTVTYHFNPTESGDKTVVISKSTNPSITTANYATLLSAILPDAFNNLKDKEGYYTEGELSAPTSGTALTQYNTYKRNYDKYAEQVNTLTERKAELGNEIKQIQDEEESDSLYTQLTTANTNLTNAQTVLDGYNDTIAEYTATEDAQGNPYKGANDATVSYINYLSYLQTVAQSEYTTAQETATAASTTLTESRSALRSAKAEQATAQTAYDNALDAAQEAANEVATAKAQENYNEITLTGDVTVETMINDTYDGTINGNGYIINATAANAFADFTGTIIDLGIEGTFCSAIKGHYQNVAVVAANGEFRWYDDDQSTPVEKFGTLNELGYAARAAFGVNIAKQSLAKLTDDTKVYGVKVYSSPQVNPANWTYTNIKDGAFVNIDAVAENVFVESRSDDFGEIANVFSGTTCPNAVITEGKSLYCPADLTANKVSYSRQNSESNTSNMFAVCLPFSLDLTQVKGAKVCTFDNESDGKFWFEYQEETVPANTPLLIYGSSKNLTFNLTGVALAKTPTNQIVEGGRLENGTSQSLGNFKSVNAGNWLGSSQVANGRIFGLNKSGVFQVSKEETNFGPFRMVIASDYKNEANATRAIRIVNKMGIDITDEIMGQVSGVENIDAASSLSIVGGQGAIEFNADADYGKVEIYNVNGGLVTVADVLTGTTSVNVEKGIYIVMGKKVMVK